MGIKKNKGDYEYFQKITMDGLKDIQKPEIEDETGSKVVFTEQELSDPRKLYTFSGFILKFGKVVDFNFKESTLAVSEAKAKCNFMFKAKQKLGLIPSAGGITLKGTITEIPR